MPSEVGLPPREFFYTLDQIAYLLDITEPYLKNNLIHYEGRSVGFPSRHVMVAVNMAPEGETPEWRVAERHFKRWLRFKGYKFYDRGYLR